MKKQNKKTIFARLFAILGSIFLLAGIAIIILSYTPIAILSANDIVLYISLGVLLVGLFLEIIAFILILVDKKKRKAEEEKLISQINSSISGEKVLIDERGQYYDQLSKTINKARLVREVRRHPYGVYKESQFDQIVLDTLESEVTSRAGLSYFVLGGEEAIKTLGPRDALLYMLQAHFGEKAYYGKIRNGIAVFVPVLPSKEEFLGRVRRTVQLYSYTEEKNHIASKAGVAFYPDFAPRLLTAEALKATLEKLSLNIHSNETSAPHLGYDAAEKEAFMLHKNRFLNSFSKEESASQMDEAYRNFVRLSLPYLSADSAGAILFNDAHDAFEMLAEISAEDGASFSLFVDKDGRLPLSFVGPLYDWSIEEKGPVSAGDGLFLPDRINSPLAALGVSSIAALAVENEGEKVGFVYVTGKEKNRFGGSKIVLEFLETTRIYLLARNAAKEKETGITREEILLSSFDHYAYGVATDSYSLSYLSPNLAKAIPEARVGATCYEVLFGNKKPCKNCPLLEKDVEKVMPRLASGVFAYKPVQGDKETLLILSHHKADFSPSRIDPLTGLLSDKSLHEDLQSEILLKDSSGVILAFRVRNLDAIARFLRLSEYDQVIKLVGDALFAAGLGRGLYRNGENGFAYLLPFASKDEGIDLAEKLSRTFSAKIPFMDKQVEVVLDYVLVSYPLEAETPFALDAILRILYSRADASSRGRLFEVNNEKGRLVDVDYYLRTKIEEGLRSKRLPVSYYHYDELAGKRTAYLEAVLTIAGEDGKPSDYRRVASLAKALGKGREVYEAMINTIARFLGANRKAISSSGVQGIILKVDEDCFNEAFVDAAATMLDNNKAIHHHLVFEVDEKLTHEKRFPEFARMARAKGMKVGIGDYKGKGKDIFLTDYAFISFPASTVYGVGKKEFLLSLSNVRRSGINVLVNGYRDNEERRYFGSLSFHYGRKDGEKPLVEEEIVF